MISYYTEAHFSLDLFESMRNHPIKLGNVAEQKNEKKVIQT